MSDEDHSFMQDMGGWRQSLSGRLLLATIFFVMLAEVLIFVPSIAQFRKTWLEDKLAGAQIATLVLLATDDNMVSDELRAELLKNAGAHVVALKRDDQRRLILAGAMPPAVDAGFDLRGLGALDAVADAFLALGRNDNRKILVKGMARHAAGDYIEVVIDEAPLRAAMIDYATNILALSLVISIFTAALVYRTLHNLLVGPMRRLTSAMVSFRDDPLNGGIEVKPNMRVDEIGQAEHALADMQADVREALRQREHLAALGTAVSKINHDMRNILTSVQIMSDRLVESEDPQVQRLSPKLLAALDRAVRLTENVLKFGSTQEAPPTRTHLGLYALVEDVIATACPVTEGEGDFAQIDQGQVRLENNVDRALVAVADADHLFRILLNLVRNAVQAFAGAGQAGMVCIDAQQVDDELQICIMDNGPGISKRAQETLFKPFHGSTSGGTGLGLTIAQELAKGHGGEITLDYTGENGTQFSIRLPNKGVNR